jgi:hypothetical protein
VPGYGFNRATFKAVQKQLATEMFDISEVRGAIGNWQNLFSAGSFQSFVSASRIGTNLVKRLEEDAKLKPKKEAEVNGEAIISEALYMASEVAGYGKTTEYLKIPQTIALVAGAFGMAEAATPEPPEEAEGPTPGEIRGEATSLGTKLVGHFTEVQATLNHLETILTSDWGKLQEAAVEARGGWAFGEREQKILGQGLAVNVEQQLYEGLLPLVYEQWVVSPYSTPTNRGGPQAPGNSYKCVRYHEGSEESDHPFKSEPIGALDTSVYRPFDTPGSQTLPALPNTTAYTIRALKSKTDAMKVRKINYFENQYAVTVLHDGSNPEEQLINSLFKPVNGGETNVFEPKDLGMSKTAFFAEFGKGPTDWPRMICAVQ